MNRKAQYIQGQVRRLPLISDDRARLLSDADAKQALFEEITAMPVTEALETPTPTPTAKRPRISRGAGAVVFGLTAVAVGGIAWAGIGATADAGPSTGCHISAGSVSIVKSVTGDPVTDCAAEWRRETGVDAPPLLAYDNGHGGIEVVAAGTAALPGWTRLDPGIQQDPTLIRLDAALDDSIDGLASGCLPLAPARDVVRRELDSLNLNNWSTSTERGAADGNTTCTYYYLDTVNRRVVLVPTERAKPNTSAPYSVLAAALRQRLAQTCDSLPQAVAFTRQAAEHAGVDKVTLVVNEVTDKTMTCTQADMNVGGRVEITLRGPGTR